MIHTHWLALSKNTKNEEGLQAEEDEQKNQGHELIEGVEGIGLVLPVQGVVPVAGPAEASVESNVTRSNEHDDSRDQKQADRDGGAVI